MRRFLILLCITISFGAHAQLSYYNSDAYWGNFCLQTDCIKPALTDTCLVFVTNRHFYKDSLRFVDEFVDTAGLKYFVLQKQADKWNVFQVRTLADAMQLMPEKRDIVVYAEGMGKIFTSNVERALLMRSQYNVNVVMFDYASINTTYKPSRNFRFARTNARLSAPQYFRLLQLIQQARRDRQDWVEHIKVSTFCHSMGNIIFMEMMKHQPYDQLNKEPFIDNVVLNAACVPSKGHKEWVERIRFANKIYINYNRSDWQLKGAHLLTLAPQLGEKVKRPRAMNASYVNFREQVGGQHSYFLNFPQNEYRMTQEMKDYFTQLFSGNNAVLEEEKTLAKKQPGVQESVN
ncbi:alpha/beta hydrolase [Chitinophaga filiformis]|uniref:Alpha/beta hydrolase n=1 Tax=Chitinophaga filiformis TaxID=104663 RepID=A0ABY4I4W2_CHIFI|nr:alpha/beta hydrolase [Chitinophaga filiformis]UPK70650.1 alpha/beta hydrolase [Chitinophaga filiformis]